MSGFQISPITLDWLVRDSGSRLSCRCGQYVDLGSANIYLNHGTTLSKKIGPLMPQEIV